MQIFKKWASREYSISQRLLGLLPAGALFVGLIPYALIWPIPRLDAVLGLPRLSFGVANWIGGGLLILMGAVYAFWSISAQLGRARGTPLPMMATQTLLVDGPFKQCRNPMALGTFLLYAGISVLVGSLSSLGAVALFAAFLLTYIKRIEERELEARFGAAYIAYKAATPFIIPAIFRK